MALFSVIATPIGNLEDITLRALKVLATSDVVLCEDTRMTKRLLDRHAISVPTKSYHMHSEISRVEEIISLLKEGKHVSLVSDAGTPGISDPGSELVRIIRQELKVEIDSGELKIEGIPGPSAVTTALSIAGVSCADFTFLGFLPHKKGRETLFKEIASAERTMVFYESPHRIMKTIESLIEHVRDTKKVTVCRELTKIFEETVAGTAQEIRAYFELHPDKIKGEFVVIVS
ncbi:MAG: 16S rRNA (cytidine(1402)-2'-O)-methyltransferase [Candidatus Taylorbacteria bacterium]